jgi:hypothetical protein
VAGVYDIPGITHERYSCDTLNSFADTLRRLLDAAWGTGWGVFSDEETTFDDPENMQLPYIVFHLVSREPNKELTPLKKRFFETMPDTLYEGHHVEVWRKWYDCRVDFLCYARTDREARYWTNKLEAFIDTYAGYFKENGMSELIFLGEGEAGRTRIQTGNLAVRTLRYLVRVEEIRIVRGKLLEDLSIQVKQQQTTT